MAGEEREYTIHLDQVFQGPMDLLLHLVREQEVDIHDIELTPVIDGYLRYLRELEHIDIELASEFALMAATLMSIKSRSLLPREEIDLEAELDPRDELIQRLIEYRRFRQAADGLGQRFAARSRWFARGDFQPPTEAPELDVSELTSWNLLSEFSRLRRETSTQSALHIQADSRPLRFYLRQMVDWLGAQGEISLRDLVRRSAASQQRPQLVGSFCAILELVKLGAIKAWQPHRSADITLQLRDESRARLDELLEHVDAFEEDAAQDPTEEPPSTAASADAAESVPQAEDPLRN